MKNLLEKDLEKVKNNPSYTKGLLQNQLTNIALHSILKSLIIYTSIANPKFRETFKKYIMTSKDSVDEYLKNSAVSEEQQIYCLEIVDNIFKEYLDIMDNLNKLEENDK